MFGYITVNQEELKIKDYNRYRSFYCGLCGALDKKHGKVAQMALSYDMTFLTILLNALYDIPLREAKRRCMIHPVKKHEMLYNEISDYAADMSILLAYYNALDDVEDDASMPARSLAGALKKPVNKVAIRYPRQSKAVTDYVRDLAEAEARGEKDLDKISGLTGSMLGEIFVWKEDEWSDELRAMGYFMGKYIYLMDAFEDLEHDRKKHEYNPWEQFSQRCDFDAIVENALTMMMAEVAKAFERLPIIEDTEILRNIIYSGVWSKYKSVCDKREKEEGLR